MKRSRGWLIPAFIALVVVFGARIFIRGPLPTPWPSSGRVVDAETLQPIQGAKVTYEWRIFNYPMLDGGGSYSYEAVFVTDANGDFQYVTPNKSGGLWDNQMCRPEIKAYGYETTAQMDWPGNMRFYCGTFYGQRGSANGHRRRANYDPNAGFGSDFPMGFNHSAQGWSPRRPTLGSRPPPDVNPNGVASVSCAAAPFDDVTPRDDATLSGLIVYFDANPG